MGYGQWGDMWDDTCEKDMVRAMEWVVLAGRTAMVPTRRVGYDRRMGNQPVEWVDYRES